MTLSSKRLTLISCALSLSLSSVAATQAQIPGVPGTAGPSATSIPNNSILTGSVKTGIAPAEKLLSQGKYSDAEGLFRELLVQNPGDLRATDGLGMSLAK